MPPFAPASLYPILDVRPGHPRDRVLALAEAVVAAGVPWLQLRAKALGTGAHVELTRALVRLASPSGAKVIVNDRLDVALAAGAAGVHLGQEDLPVAVARATGGRPLVIGVSTHSVEEALSAEGDGADYVGFGPMYPTRSKTGALLPRRAEDLRAVRAAIALPIVAIGGIGEATAGDVLASGADSVAMISALETHPRPAELARRLLALARASKLYV